MKGNGRAALEECRQHPDKERFVQAASVGVSEPMIAWARRILRFGAPELVRAVESGEIALYKGAWISKMPPAEQRRFLRLDDAPGEPATLKTRCAIAPSPSSQERET